MRAVEVTGFGGPDRLALIEAPDPEPGAGELGVRIRACGLNHSDLLMREGIYLGGPRPPFRPGIEAAGMVETRGEEMGDDAPAIGARVAVLGDGGLQASAAAVPAAACVPIPETLSFEAAAALPVAFLTAFHALATVARAEPGETVLIHGAAGGVGTAAVQVARRLGLRVVATASTAEKRARVEALGADAVTGYEGFERAVRALARGGPEIVLETIGGDVLRRSLRILAPLGRLVVIGFSSREPRPVDTVQLLYRSQSVCGFHLQALLARRALFRESMERLLGWAAAGEVVPQVGHVLPLAEIRRAHELLASRESYGKIVLVPGAENPP